MARCLPCAVVSLLALCVPLEAQTRYVAPLGPLGSSLLRLPAPTLSDTQFFSFATAFNRMETTAPDFLPPWSASDQFAFYSPASRRDDRSKEVAPGGSSESKEVSDVRRSNLLDNVHGEVGFLYGRSSGRFGGEVEQGHIITEIGDDKVHITVGAFYEDSTFHFPRSR